MRIRYRARANADIARIYQYIAEHNERAARTVVARIRAAVERLGILPRLGHAGRVPGTYEWSVVGLPYVVVYEIDEAVHEIAVLAVFHTARKRN